MSIHSRNRGIWVGVALLASVLVLAGCGGDSDSPITPTPTPTPTPTTPTPTPPPEPDVPDMVTYDIQYTALISSNPLLQALGAAPFPEGVVAASPLALVAHAMDAPLWEEGGMASPGLKLLAEMGDSSEFIAEATAMEFVTLMSTSDQLTALLTTPELEVSSALPCFTFAQQIEPSPDWFFGFSSVCTLDEDGNWIDEITLTAIAYDAGTAEGDSYAFKAEGGDTDPQGPITELDMAPFSPAGTPLSHIVATRRQ